MASRAKDSRSGARKAGSSSNSSSKDRRPAGRTSGHDRDDDGASAAAQHSGSDNDEATGARGGNTRAAATNGATGMNNAQDSMPLILFNQSKNELKPLNGGGFKQLQTKFRNIYRFQVNKEELTRDRLEGVRGIIFPGSRMKLEVSEIKVLNEFLLGGGGILILGSEPTENNGLNGSDDASASILLDGGEGSGRTSGLPDDYTVLNKFTEGHGIVLCSDAVVRTVYAKEYFHPKEVLIKGASMVKSLDQALSSIVSSSATVTGGKVTADGEDEESEDGGGSGRRRMNIVYPFGATLKVSKPAIPLISSGELSFPANRALLASVRVGGSSSSGPSGLRGSAAAAAHTNNNHVGTLLVLGSVQLFQDDFISKADNMILVTSLLSRLVDPSTTNQLVKSDRVENDCMEYNEDSIQIPDTEALAERLRSCLQETEELPLDFTVLFDHTLYKYDTNLIPQAVKLYERLNVKHEPLSLIPPQFEVPLPPLQPAVFMPCMRELPPPSLDLFDLDEHFSTEKLRLAQLTNKCTDKDLEYFICDAGEILGIADQIRAAPSSTSSGPSKYSANKVLEFILRKLVDWKKLDRDSVDGNGNGNGGNGNDQNEGGGGGMLQGAGGAGYDSSIISPGGNSQSFVMPDSPKQSPQPLQSNKPRGGKITAMGSAVPEMRGSVGGAGGQQQEDLDLDD